MPNLVVYVPARLWSRLEALGLEDAKVEARQVAIGALEEFIAEEEHSRPQRNSDGSIRTFVDPPVGTEPPTMAEPSGPGAFGRDKFGRKI